jgi:cyclic pyranopterin phosphate synthase
MLIDTHGRKITYLRVSVTDRCNLRCHYCMPREGVALRDHHDMLSFEEIETIVRAAVELGIRKVRLTGGEPLLRKDFPKLAVKLGNIPRLEELDLTTNGLLFAPLAGRLKQAGIKRVNISLDTLKPERFREMSGSDDWRKVMESVEAAVKHGYEMVKLNVVAVAGYNDDEAGDFVRFALDHGLHLRFIELMPLGNDYWTPARTIAGSEVKSRVEKAFQLTPLPPNGVAEEYQIKGSPITVGFINPLSHPFCRRCNRLRLTADGFLRPCLAGQAEINLREPVRHGMAGPTLRRLFYEALRLKPEGHRFNGDRPESNRLMAEIGG